MTVVSLKTENSYPQGGSSLSLRFSPLAFHGVVKVEFSDGSSLTLSTDYLEEGTRNCVVSTKGEKFALLEPGRELSFADEEAFRFAAACYRAEKTALRLIARAEQNSLGIIAKLERRCFDTAVAKAVVCRLLDRNLLDNGRYAELWIRSHLALRKAPSPLWLLAALGKRGIDAETSRKALAKVLDPDTEYGLLLRYIEKAGFPKDKRVLKHKGFSSAVLNRYFDN